MPNRLANERSPYLLQHANNPVDWYPWGDDAFARAKRENKPIFLSIGYSTCHWCHVMEHESFENAVDRGRAQQGLRLDQARSRRTAGRRSRLHDVRAGDDRRRRLADERVADAGSQAVLRRNVFSADEPVGTARVPRRADPAGAGHGATTRRGSSSRPRTSSIGCATRPVPTTPRRIARRSPAARRSTPASRSSHRRSIRATAASAARRSSRVRRSCCSCCRPAR